MATSNVGFVCTTSTTTDGADTVWRNWVNVEYATTATTGGVVYSGTYTAPEEQLPRMTPEQAAALNVMEREQRLEREQARQESIRADELSLLMLRSQLTPEQIGDFDRLLCFTVHGAENDYRIKKGRAYNITRMSGRSKDPAEKMCIVPNIVVPIYDQMLAQKLMIEHFEPLFLRLANRTPF